MAILLYCATGASGLTVFGSVGGGGHGSDAWVERSRVIASCHFSQWDDLDLRRMAGCAELLETLAAEVAHRVHGRFEEFARIEFAPALGRDFAECGGHRQPAVGVDVDLADAMLDVANDLLDRHAPGLRHLAAELVEGVLQRLRHRR